MRVALLCLLALAAGCQGEEMERGRGPYGCDDPDRPPGLEWRTGVPDVDGDGYGSGDPVTLCLTLGDWQRDGWVPSGGPTDCAPFDASHWAQRPFAGRDEDGDGVPVVATGEICTGDSLPPGYLETEPTDLLDCDDHDANAWEAMTLFADLDYDGVGGGEASPTCVGFDVPGDWSLTGGDCAPYDGWEWQLLDYFYRDADGDGYTIDETGQVCGGLALPVGYSTWPSSPDCDDELASRFQTWIVYADEDRDGVGAGDSVSLCAGFSLPSGYSSFRGDCASADGTMWRLLAYSHRDADLDTYTVAEAGTTCAGTSLPAGYSTRAGTGTDCRDSDPLFFRLLSGYPDIDGDGLGAGALQSYCSGNSLPPGAVTSAGDCAPEDAALHTSLTSFVDVDGDGIGAGDPATLCTGGTRPPGQVGVGGDCAPGNGTAWRVLPYRFVDRDGDGRTVVDPGQVCTGAALPPPYRAEASGNDCDDRAPALLGWTVLYEDLDGDGVGAGERSIRCIGASPPVELSIHGDDADDGDPIIQTDEDDDDELEQILI